MNTGSFTRYVAFATCKDIFLCPESPAVFCTRLYNPLNSQTKDPEISCCFNDRWIHDFPSCVSTRARRRSAHEDSTGFLESVISEKEVPTRTKTRFSHRKEIAERGGAGMGRRRLKSESHW